MNVIEKISNRKNFIASTEYQFWSNKEKAEILQLAKLGQAALEAGYPCEPDNGYNHIECMEIRCKWQDFCKLRQGVQP